jgi:UDPglucose--hexose-1-phosphate uridylyltransferase
MLELRVDPLSGQRAIVASGRSGRPGGELAAPPFAPIDPKTDPFAEGHEKRTPPELYAVRPNVGEPNSPGWTVRVVPNLYPALSNLSEQPEPQANPDLFWAAPALGSHEVIVNSPKPVVSLSQLSAAEVATATEVWRERMRVHRDAAYVHLSVNERREAGASLPHTHSQLYALGFVPAAVARERERFGAYATRTMGSNLLADLVQAEVRQRQRIVAIDEDVVLIAPYGARVPFQLMIAPRVPRMRFEEDGPTGAAMIHDALSRLARRLGSPPPLNLWVRTAPRGSEYFCWRIDILPRLTHLAGLELGVGLHLNVVSPEQAAAELREI